MGSQQVVLVGGGHANVQLLRASWPADVDVTLVSDRPAALYSGMVPGWIAGRYRESELSIDLAALCRACGSRFILDACKAIDTDAQRMRLAGGDALPYDVAAVDIGSGVSSIELPGVREFAIPTRPLAELPAAITALASDPDVAKRGILVVGGGAGGVELGFALRARLGPDTPIELLDRGTRLLADRPPRVGRRVAAALRRRRIAVRLESEVVRGSPNGLELSSGECVAAARWIWVTGAAPPGLFRASGMSTDDAGFLRVRPTLQSLDADNLLAAGDCVSLEHAPKTPRAGVYAVRAGPVLLRNLRALLAGKPLAHFEPQADFLTLLDLADGTAIGTKWGLCFEGRGVSRLKEWIDRRFVEKFQA